MSNLFPLTRHLPTDKDLVSNVYRRKEEVCLWGGSTTVDVCSPSDASDTRGCQLQLTLYWQNRARHWIRGKGLVYTCRYLSDFDTCLLRWTLRPGESKRRISLLTTDAHRPRQGEGFPEIARPGLDMISWQDWAERTKSRTDLPDPQVEREGPSTPGTGATCQRRRYASECPPRCS